jgi:hypothetical protein
MVKEHEIALPHLFHVVSRLIVPYAFPVVGGPGLRLQVVKGKYGRLRLHQPELFWTAHFSPPLTRIMQLTTEHTEKHIDRKRKTISFYDFLA